MAKRILVVEDEERICKIFEAVLTRDNYAVITACDAETALPIIKEQNPRLLLLDINLPHMTGIDLLKLVREFNKDVKVFILSGLNLDTESVAKLKTLNVTKFIPKPINIVDLEQTIKEL